MNGSSAFAVPSDPMAAVARVGRPAVMFLFHNSEALVRVFRGWKLPDGPHLTKHVNLLAGLSCLCLVCLRLMQRVPGLVATLFVTQPLLFGSAFINPKDIPAVALLMAIMALGLAAGDLQQPLETEEGVLRPTCTTLLGPPRLSRPSKQLTAMSEYDRCVSAIQTRCRSSTRS